MNAHDVTRHAADHVIRTRFFLAMSAMYRSEVPLYGDLLDIVAEVNATVLAAHPDIETGLRERGELERLSQERHGAIRVGTAEELSTMRRVFAVMGMHPVGYYDLSVAGVPVHSTAFRPTRVESLNANPFRVFTSLLRLDLIPDPSLRARATELLDRRRIFTPRLVELVERFERDGGLAPDDVEDFVDAALDTFRWHSDSPVDESTYRALNDVHRLVADVVCFKGPHINHLTPRTLDIDAAQSAMLTRGIDAKDVIEGPPRRSVPILLRQTSFKALQESIRFADGRRDQLGSHTARFGEIEQRGVALTPAGRALYDELLEKARGSDGSASADYEQRLAAAFEAFPDDLEEIRREGLGYFRYRVVGDLTQALGSTDIDDLVALGVVEASPVVYEDFLPVSAAGVFQSNLGGTEQQAYQARAAREEFIEALGAPVAEPFDLYETTQAESLAAVRAALSWDDRTGPTADR